MLCKKDAEMLHDFSRRCIGRLSRHLPLRIFLSLFQRFLNANVVKEAEKDRLIIEQASAIFEAGRERGNEDIDEIFEKGKEVDSDFIRKVSVPPLTIEVRYDEISDIRRKRIVCLGNTVFELLGNWNDAVPFPVIVKSTYTERRFTEVLGEILHLYNLETRMLGNSITFHKPADKVKDLFARRLFSDMEDTAGEIAGDYTRRIYAGKGLSCAHPT